jgi:hypothetical protein
MEDEDETSYIFFISNPAFPVRLPTLHSSTLTAQGRVAQYPNTPRRFGWLNARRSEHKAQHQEDQQSSETTRLLLDKSREGETLIKTIQ